MRLRSWIAKKKKNLSENNVPQLEWPACSLDIDPIENIRCILKQKVVFKLLPKPTLKLKDSMRKTGAAIDPNKCEDLVKSMSDSLTETRQLSKQKVETQGINHVFDQIFKTISQIERNSSFYLQYREKLNLHKIIL